jgi:hypothetical protein
MVIQIPVTGGLPMERVILIIVILFLIPALASAQSTSQSKEKMSFSGKVTRVECGKDGRTVELTNEATGKKLYATISIPNLGPNTVFDFNDIKLGHKLEVVGKPFLLGEDRYITATQAKRIE